jgi:hypothetical protein
VCWWCEQRLVTPAAVNRRAEGRVCWWPSPARARSSSTTSDAWRASPCAASASPLSLWLAPADLIMMTEPHFLISGIATLWLEPADYPVLLGCADLGTLPLPPLSPPRGRRLFTLLGGTRRLPARLHFGTRPADEGDACSLACLSPNRLRASPSLFPTFSQVLDMLGCGLPVCAVGLDSLSDLQGPAHSLLAHAPPLERTRFDCLSELVVDGTNGRPRWSRERA